MNIWKISTMGFATAFAMTLTLVAARPAHAELQPKMQSALALLKIAKEQLQEATPDKGGHRVKAIQLTNDAIDEVKKGIDADNKN